ncbi:MAG: hypothetical protein FRX48_00965 [Lasallia pustulata]|uniref:DUF7730 domain-containing protein n=1 Tax=Lasallia pustulata TaxID=136370 RepID=A0A5M8Q4W4_9LECA|nr:MAG: hypothetical protein FRX48_00965 [Lasallia pustulata]
MRTRSMGTIESEDLESTSSASSGLGTIESEDLESTSSASSGLGSSTAAAGAAKPEITCSKPSPFFKLPVEIRTRIYQLVLKPRRATRVRRRARKPIFKSTTRSGKDIRANTDPGDLGRVFGATAFSLPSTCRQIYLESVSIYYRERSFFAFNSRFFHNFLAAIGPSNANLITMVYILDRDWCRAVTFRSLADLEGLKQIRRVGWTYDWPKYDTHEYILPASSLQDLVVLDANMKEAWSLTLCCRGRTVADREKCEAKNGSFDCWVNDIPTDEQ